MPQRLPFEGPEEIDDHSGGRAVQCPLHNILAPELREQADAQPHLMSYLHKVPMAEFGVPEYFPEVTRKMGDIKDPNLIYPVGGNTFIHIFPDAAEARNYYIAIEPGSDNLGEYLELVEIRLLDVVELLAEASTPEEKTEVLLRVIDDNCEPSDGAAPVMPAVASGEAGFLKLPFSGSKGNGKGRLHCTRAEVEALKYMVVRDKVGMGPLEPLISDPWIEDISCSGVGPVYIEHKIFGALKSSINFDNHEELDDFVLKLAEKMKKPVTFRNPIVDATLPDGSRINIVYGGDVSKNGSNFTIRKFMGIPLSVVDICNSGMLTWQMAGYMSLIVEEGMNFFVSGETASGKTTLMNALMTFVPPSAKIVSIEDTPEVQVPHPNWTREVVRGQMSAQGGSVDMFALLKAALRQRPNMIIIGEIRGEEGNIAFQAMMTGHAVSATFHAATVEKLIQRVTGHPINVPRTYVENLNCVVICSAVRLPSGKIGRRIISISEIIGYDPVQGSFSFVEVFRWDPVKDEFEFVGFNNSYLLEQRIAPSRGLSEKKRRMIYKEVDRRGALLQKLGESGVSNFYELFKLLSKAQKQGLF
ncbi:MAG TPA: type II/IV secretion system ATPase subunit [Dehalococcoidia bacterium]|jgi:flagellar protein FlaI